MMMRVLLVLCILLLPGAVWAQERDRGFIAGLLEDSLGGEGRDVQIFGFAGALSSRATIERITISDDDGIWLTMDDIGLQWARAALLRGRIDVQELSAGSIELTRLPASPESDLPAAEATEFKLPELPVAIRLEALSVTELTLGASVLGQEAVLSLSGAGRLESGEGDVSLRALRVDGQLGELAFEAAYADGTKDVALRLNLTEAPGGIAAKLLDLPGHPSVSLRLDGSGTLNDLTTELALITDGEERLSGEVVLSAVEAASDAAGTARRIEADIGGDITALFAPQYRSFFGADVQLVMAGVLAGDGALSLDALDLRTEALQLQGEAALNRDYWPTFLQVEGRLGMQSGGPVLLPLSGPETYVDSATFRLDYDQSDGEAWDAHFDVFRLVREGLSIGEVILSASGILDGDVNAVGTVSAALELAVEALDLGDPALNAATGRSVSGRLDVDYVEGQPLKLRGLRLAGTDYALSGQADIGALDEGFETEFDLGLDAGDLSRFADLAGQDLSGSAQLSLKGVADLGGAFDLTLSGQGTDLAIGQMQADAVLAGQTVLAMEATRTTEGLRLRNLDIRNPQVSLTGDAQIATGAADLSFDASLADAGLVVPGLEGPLSVSGTALQDAQGISVDVDADGPYDARANVKGLATGPNAEVAFTTDLPDISKLLPAYNGAVSLEGVARQSPEGWLVETDLAGPYDLRAAVQGRVSGTDAPDLLFEANLPDIKPLVPQYSGAVALSGKAQQLADGWHVATDMRGPFGSTASIAGRATGENAPDIKFEAKLPDIEPLAPQYSGPVAATGTARMQGETLSIQTDATGPYGLVANVSGTVTGTTPELRYSVRMPDIAPVVAQLSGPLQLDGTARQQGQNWFVDTAVQGPAGTVADVVGRVGADGQLGLGVAGAAPLALANPFISPRNMQGQAQFNLRVDGPASLGSVSGQITTRGARLSAPTLREALNDIAADITLSGGRATVAVTAAVQTGGTVSIRGPVTLTGAMPAALEIDLNAVQLIDPALYRSTVNGALSVNGNLAGGARIAGRIDVGETQISVPSGGVGGFAIIPEITHIRPSAAVRATQRRAGLLKETSASSGPNARYPLDITISAPARIFVRGRGLDAELGGSLRLTGTTADIISAGRFELIRGRLDILEKRFVLDEGSIQLQGSFDPFLRFVATTATSSGTASIIIEGLASEPKVRFESSPEAPEDEVLAQIFFGRQVTQLSAFQALQLASAVATLAGQGGEGVVSKLRRSFALDDLDVTTNAEGDTELTAGKYISDNVYTDVTVGGAEGAEVSINVDLTPSVTVRGSANSVGDTSVGIYFEKDY